MNALLLNLLTGRRHQAGTLLLMRGQTFMEVIEEGGMAIVVLLSGHATISRPRTGEQSGLHLTPHTMEPVWLTVPGTYSITARDPTLAVRLLRRAEEAKA